MGRRLLALSLTVAIQAAALSAPLVHAHVDDHHDDHHAGARIHAHAGGHGASHHDGTEAPALREQESPEQAVAIPMFVATETAAPIQPSIIQAPFLLTAAAVSLMRRAPHDVRSHGPPGVTIRSPRAPPLHLS